MAPSNPLRRRMLMAIPALPFSFPNATTAYRRIVETINNILNFSFDDSRARSPAEIAAGVEPVQKAWPSGPLRYGAKGDGATDDAAAWNTLGRVLDHQFVPARSYLLNSKVQVIQSCTIEGAGRSAVLKSGGFSDYLLEIGHSSTGGNSQAGALHRLSFAAGAGNTACLHLQPQAHMWRLDDLLFRASPCPAIIVDGCWDANWTNIDILNCTNLSGNPATSASVIVRNDCNNLYLRGVRIEGAQSGAYYIGDSRGMAAGGAGPIYLVNGKVDCGYGPQHAAAMTIKPNGTLLCDNWTLAGINRQWCFDLQGSLRLHHCFISGATGMSAAIRDRRQYYQINPQSVYGTAPAACKVYIAPVDLGNAYFAMSSPFINQVTPAVIDSKIWPVRAVFQIAVIANAGATGKGWGCRVSPPPPADHAYNGMYLVLNRSGTSQLSRRRIIASDTSGLVTLAGSATPALGTDYSLEYAGGHATPIRAENVQMESGMELFATLQTGLRISDTPIYTVTDASGAYGGMTRFAVSPKDFPANTDLAGYYLVDEETGEPFLIGYGVDGAGRVGVFYDRTSKLDSAHEFSIVAGYYAGVHRRGDSYEWRFAGIEHRVTVRAADRLGFDRDNIPLWSFAAAGGTTGPMQ